MEEMGDEEPGGAGESHKVLINAHPTGPEASEQSGSAGNLGRVLTLSQLSCPTRDSA